MRKSVAVAQSVLLRMAKELETEYADAKSEASKKLHEAIAKSISAQQADVQTILYVLELLRFEVLFQKYDQLFNEPAAEPIQVEEQSKGE